MQNEIEKIKAAIKSAYMLLGAIEQAPKRNYSVSSERAELVGALGALQAITEQFEAIGAGGVESLRKKSCLHQIQEPMSLPKPEFYADDCGYEVSAEWLASDEATSGYRNAYTEPRYTEQQVRALLAGVSAPAAAQGGE